jgi:hypothetical protein
MSVLLTYHSTAKGGSSVVEHTSTDPEVEGSNLATNRYQEKMAEKNTFNINFFLSLRIDHLANMHHLIRVGRV